MAKEGDDQRLTGSLWYSHPIGIHQTTKCNNFFFSVHIVKSKEVQVFNTFHDAGTPPSLHSHPLIIFNQTGRAARRRSIIFTTRPTGQLGLVFFLTSFLDIFAENFVKVIEPIGMQRLHSSRSSRERRRRNSRHARAAQFTHTRRRSALTAAPVNQFINVIQNTATGLITRKPQWTLRPLRPSISPLNSSLFAPITIHGSRKGNIQLHVHHNQFFI